MNRLIALVALFPILATAQNSTNNDSGVYKKAYAVSVTKTNPTIASELASKAYVDAHSGGGSIMVNGGLLTLSGGTNIGLSAATVLTNGSAISRMVNDTGYITTIDGQSAGGGQISDLGVLSFTDDNSVQIGSPTPNHLWVSYDGGSTWANIWNTGTTTGSYTLTNAAQLGGLTNGALAINGVVVTNGVGNITITAGSSVASFATNSSYATNSGYAVSSGYASNAPMPTAVGTATNALNFGGYTGATLSNEFGGRLATNGLLFTLTVGSNILVNGDTSAIVTGGATVSLTQTGVTTGAGGSTAVSATNATTQLVAVGTGIQTVTVTAASAYYWFNLTTNTFITADLSGFPTNLTAIVGLSLNITNNPVTFDTNKFDGVTLLSTPSTNNWNFYVLSKGVGQTNLVIQGAR